MDSCRNCFISKSFPGVTLDETGLCNHCRAYVAPSPEADAKIRAALEDELAQAAAQLRKKKHKYHCAVALSGGKDSSYITWLLSKKYKLNVLAISVDIGYLQPQAYTNIGLLTQKLGVDHMFFKDEHLFKTIYKYGFTNGFFSKNQGMACSICCKLIPNVILSYCHQNDIPWVAKGNYSIDKPELFLDTGKFILSQEKFDPVLFKFLTNNKVLCAQKDERVDVSALPRVLHPLNTVIGYTAQKVYDELQAHTGITKDHFFSEKTTCVISMVTMYMYQKARGYNPYASDVSNQVRHGIIDKDNVELRDTLLNVADKPETKELVKKTLKSIGVISP